MENSRWLNNGGSGDHCMNFGSFTDCVGKPLKGFELGSSISDVILTIHLAVVWRLDGRGCGTQKCCSTNDRIAVCGPAVGGAMQLILANVL